MSFASRHGFWLGIRFLAPVVAFAVSGCGDDSVAFSDVPPLGGGSAGAASPSGGSTAQMVTSGPSVTTTAAGTGAGGSMTSVESNAAGAEPVSTPTGTAGASGAPAAAGAATAGAATAGAAGAGPGPGNKPTEAFDLIDDVEGPFPSLPQTEGRDGGWFAVHDDSDGQLGGPTAVALQPARGTSHFAAGISGAGFTDWGAQLGVALKSPAVGYDASKYCGLRFMAKGSGAGWTLLVSDRTSVPQGGVCDPNSWDPEQACYNYVGKDFGVGLGSDWQEVKIRFDDLRLVEDPASARRLDSSALYDIVFNFYDPYGAAFQLLVDDLSFMENCQ